MNRSLSCSKSPHCPLPAVNLIQSSVRWPARCDASPLSLSGGVSRWPFAPPTLTYSGKGLKWRRFGDKSKMKGTRKKSIALPSPGVVSLWSSPLNSNNGSKDKRCEMLLPCTQPWLRPIMELSLWRSRWATPRSLLVSWHQELYLFAEAVASLAQR